MNTTRITEEEAASLFVSLNFRRSKEDWPHIREFLKDLDVCVAREEVAQLALAIARIAVGLRALNKVFPIEQAQRLRDFTLRVIASQDSMGLVQEEIEQVNDEVNFLDHPGDFDPLTLHTDPIARIGSVLYRHMGLQAANGPDFILTSALATCVIGTGCGWKDIRDAYDLRMK